MSRRIATWALGAVFAAGLAAAGELDVPIRVVERAGVARKGEPVTVGVPIPKGWLKDASGLKLVGPDGRDVPAQFSVATYWWHTGKGAEGEKSVKWVHVDFQADVKAKAETVYTLKTGGAGSAKDSPLKATLDGNTATVETGAIKFTVRGDKFNLLDEVVCGGQPVVSHDGGIVLLSNWAGGDKNSVFKSTAAPAKLEIEVSGPERVVVLARGKLAKVEGEGPDAPLDYDCRITAFRGKSYVIVELVYYNRHIDAEKKLWSCVPVDGLLVELPTALKAPMVGMPTDGGAVQVKLAEGKKACVTATASDRIEFVGGDQVDRAKGKSLYPSGARQAGRLVASNAKLSVGAGIRWFWQTWPKAVEMDGSGKLTVHLWPNLDREVREVPGDWAREGALRSRKVPGRANVYLGMSHTYRFFLSFGEAPPGVATPADEAWWRLTEPVRGVCPPRWYCEDTRGFGLLGSSTEALYEPERWKLVADYDTRVREWHDFIAYERRKKDYNSDDGFGEFNFGDHVNYDYNKGTDRPRDLLWDNNYYGFPHACVLQFARTGDLAYLDTAVEFGTHLHDIDMMCAHPRDSMIGCNRYCPSAQHIFADHSIARQSFGGKLNQAVYASNTYNHYKNQSHFERWYLLGDRHALEMGLLSARFVVKRGRNSISQGRSVGHGIVGALSAWYATGDVQYLDAARVIVRARKGFGRTKSGAWQDGIAAEGFAEYYYETGSPMAFEAAKRAARAARNANNAAGSMLQAFGFAAAHENDPALLDFAINAGRGGFLKSGHPKKSWGSVMDFGNSLRSMGWFIWYLGRGERKVTAEPLPGWGD